MRYIKPTAKANNRTSSMSDSNDEEQLTATVIHRPKYRTYVQAYQVNHIHYYISEEIGSQNEYTDMIHQINTAGPNDVIYMHLNTPGGVMETGVQIINAMRNTEAHVVTILESSAYSMGTLIFLAGDEMIVNDNCMMMFHNFNGGFVGKGNDIERELEATVKWYAALAQDIYVPFLSAEEFTRITRGEDVWMQSPEIRTRLQAMVDAEQAALDQEEDESTVVEFVAPPVKKPASKRAAKKAS